MDHRIFIVAIPFLVALIFTLFLLVKWEILDQKSASNSSMIKIENLNYTSGLIDRNIDLGVLPDFNKKTILNLTLLPSIIFFILIYTFIY